jgi:hypothetical protein
MSYKELQKALKQLKEQGFTDVAINAKRSILEDEFNRVMAMLVKDAVRTEYLSSNTSENEQPNITINDEVTMSKDINCEAQLSSNNINFEALPEALLSSIDNGIVATTINDIVASNDIDIHCETSPEGQLNSNDIDCENELSSQDNDIIATAINETVATNDKGFDCETLPEAQLSSNDINSKTSPEGELSSTAKVNSLVDDIHKEALLKLFLTFVTAFIRMWLLWQPVLSSIAIKCKALNEDINNFMKWYLKGFYIPSFA